MPRDEHFYLGCSGGVDSMAIADFYRRGGKRFSLAYFHHATPQADAMQDFVSKWAETHGIDLVTERLVTTRPKRASPEEFWRAERYRFFATLPGRVVTCHHLNDVAETWIFSALHGHPKLISPVNERVIRPFLLNPKSELIAWAERHEVPWLEDDSNRDVHYPRNRIRHQIMREALLVNPGLLTTLRKKYEARVR